MNQYLVVGIVFLVVIALLATNKKLVETLKSSTRSRSLRKRVIYTIGLLLVYRLGSFVVIPVSTQRPGRGVGACQPDSATDFWVC